MTVNTQTRPYRISRKEFISGLRGIPDHCTSSKPSELAPYECDGLTAYRRLPWLELIPETTEQVQMILQHCRQKSVPVVARGAGTGLSGGALPIEEALLSLAKFNRILEIDRDN